MPISNLQLRANGLGKITAVYRDRPLVWRDLLIVFVPATLAVLTPWAYGVYRMYYAYAKFGPVAAMAWGPPWFRLAGLALIPLLCLGFIRIWRSRWIVTLHRNGLRIQAPLRRKIILRWPQIEGIACKQTQERFMGIQLASHHKLSVIPTSGKPIHLSRKLKGQDDLCARLKAKIYPRILQSLRADMLAGKRLYFGPIQINRNNLKLWGKETPWDQVTLINLRQGRLVIKFQGRRDRKIPVGKIPNIELLIQLIQEGVEI